METLDILLQLRRCVGLIGFLKEICDAARWREVAEQEYGRAMGWREEWDSLKRSVAEDA